jgi:hypothetical protein
MITNERRYSSSAAFITITAIIVLIAIVAGVVVVMRRGKRDSAVEPDGRTTRDVKARSDVILSFDGASFATLANDRKLVGGELFSIDFELANVVTGGQTASFGSSRPRPVGGVALVYGEPFRLADKNRPWMRVDIEADGSLSATIYAAQTRAQTLRSKRVVVGAKTRAHVRISRDSTRWTLSIDGVECAAFKHTTMASIIPASGLYIGGIELIASDVQGAWTFSGIVGDIGALRFNKRPIGAVVRHTPRASSLT